MASPAARTLEHRLTAALAQLGFSAQALDAHDPLDTLVAHCQLLQYRNDALQSDHGFAPIGYSLNLLMGCVERGIAFEDCEPREAVFREIDRLRAELAGARRSHLRVIR